MRDDLLKWYKIHFPQSTFDGRIQIGFRKSGEAELKSLFISDRDMIGKFLKSMYTRQDYDYYIMANTVSGVKRRKESLFTLQNLVIDIDNHGGCTDFVHESVEELLWRLNRDLPEEMPKPTSIVETGRGVQLWWKILPVHAKCKPYFDEVREEFIRQIQIVLDEYSSLGCFTVDSTASCNDVGYFRLPFTYNTKVNTLAIAKMNAQETANTLQDLVKIVKKLKMDSLEKPAQFTPKEKMPILSEEDKKLLQRFQDSEIFILKSINTLCFFRMKQLISLRKIRNSEISLETRNNLNFIAYNTLLPPMSEEMAWEKLLLFNQDFKEPMTESELQGVIVSAKEKGGYKYSNEKLIEFLQITPEEQEKIGLYMPKDQKVMTRVSHDPARDAQRALSKEVRNQHIFELAKTDMNLTEISKGVGVSVSTVSKVLNFSEIKKIQKEKALNMIRKGYTIPRIVAETSLSRSTVKRLKSSIYLH